MCVRTSNQLHESCHEIGHILHHVAGLLEQTNIKRARCLDRCHGALSTSWPSVGPRLYPSLSTLCSLCITSTLQQQLQAHHDIALAHRFQRLLSQCRSQIAPTTSSHMLKLSILFCRALKVTGATRRCLNLSSYNYLGFAAADEYCTPRVQEVLKQYGASMCSSRLAAGDHLA